MLEERRSELLELLHEFQETFVQSPTGQQHLGFYEAHRQTGRQNFEAVQAAIEVRGVKSATDLTDTLVDQILHKLLPHSILRRTVRQRFGFTMLLPLLVAISKLGMIKKVGATGRRPHF